MNKIKTYQISSTVFYDALDNKDLIIVKKDSTVHAHLEETSTLYILDSYEKDAKLLYTLNRSSDETGTYYWKEEYND